MNIFFNAVEPGKQIGDGTVGALLDWLEQYIYVLFPENGIEYWADNRQRSKTNLLRGDTVPGSYEGEERVHHCACYVRAGSNEGRIIEINLYLRSDVFRSICWMKSFGRDDECWMVARAIQAALDSIIFYHQVPQIVGLASSIPRQQKWHRTTSLTERVTIATTPHSLTVATASGTVLDSRDWSSLGGNAKYKVENYLDDWKRVLTNWKAQFDVIQARTLHADDLRGYTISNRGAEDISGYSVLPPDGNPNDDSHYIGYFKTAEKALQGARAHRDGQPIIFT